MLFGLVIARGKNHCEMGLFHLTSRVTQRESLESILQKNDWFYAWYIVAILQLLSELSKLRLERRFKLQKILSDVSIKNEVLNHIKVNDMHWNGVSPLPEPWWPSSWTHVCVIGLQCYLSVVETIIGGHTWERQRIEKPWYSAVAKDTPI